VNGLNEKKKRETPVQRCKGRNEGLNYILRHSDHLAGYNCAQVREATLIYKIVVPITAVSRFNINRQALVLMRWEKRKKE